MILKKTLRRLTVFAGSSCLAAMILFCPASALSAQAAPAAAEATVQPCSDDIQYVYKIENGKMYKRLYNYSTMVYIGDWIYVCDYPG